MLPAGETDRIGPPPSRVARHDEGAHGVMDQEVTDTRARIQAVALELFTAQGFEKTSLREIAERLDLTKAALYYHFPSKAELFRSLVLPAKDDIDAMLEEAEAADVVPPRRLLESYFDLLCAHRRVFLSMVRDASGLAHVDLEAWAAEWIQRFQNLLVGADAPPDQQVRAVVAIGGLARSIIMPADIPVEDVRTPAVDAACAALGLEVAEPTR